MQQAGGQPNPHGHDAFQVAVVLHLVLGAGARILRGIKRLSLDRPRWRFISRGTRPVVTESAAFLDRAEGVITQVWSKRAFERMDALGVPVVNVSDTLPLPRLARVVPDSRAIGRLAAEHLLDRGHRRLAFSGSGGLHYAQERLAGFSERAAEAGIEVLVAPTGPPQQGDAHHALSTWLHTLPRPIGLLAAQDNHGRQVLYHCERLGLRVPDDIAVIGVDNEEVQADLATIPMTSVDPDFERVGYEAAQLLDHLMRGGDAPDGPIYVKPKGVVQRASTNAAAVEDDDVVRAVRFIREHAAERIGVDDVLREVLLSRRTLENKFRKALGHTPHAHLVRARLDLAGELLRDTDMTIAAVADRAGFGDARQFATTFRKHRGLPPSAYRAQHRLR